MCDRETFCIVSHSPRFSIPDFKTQLTSCKGLELYLLCPSVSPRPGPHKHTGTHSDTVWTHILVDEDAVGLAGQQVVCLAAEIKKEIINRQLLILPADIYKKKNNSECNNQNKRYSSMKKI